MIRIKQLLVPFAAWGTPLQSKSFTTAVWQLTMLYAAAVGAILTFFSVVVFQVFTQTIGRTSIGLFADEFRGDTLQHEIAEHLFSIIIYTDIGCFVAALFFAYLLARRTLQPLEQNYLLQKQFIADTAHELRTPLAVMKSGSEVLLRQDRSASEYKQGIKTGLEETNRLIDLTNGLLLLARPPVLLVDAPIFSLSSVVSAQCQQIQSYASSHDVVVQTSVVPDVYIHGRAHEMGQAVLNMVKNAIDYNQSGGSVTVTLLRTGNDAVMTIADTGIGIAPDQLPHIFERFYKADSARTGTENSGAGLGLAIVKESIQAHGGRVEVVSKVGVGTVCTVTLPVAVH